MLGGYMSPVNDAYRKPDLAPATHRSAAARLVSLCFLRLDHCWPAAPSSILVPGGLAMTFAMSETGVIAWLPDPVLPPQRR